MRSSEVRGYDSRASNYGLLSWTSRLLLYHYTIEMKLRVNENIIIDSIDELYTKEEQKRTETSIKNNEIEG